MVSVTGEKRSALYKIYGRRNDSLVTDFLICLSSPKRLFNDRRIRKNGLHYSIQKEVWEKLFKIAKELDIQVFATTHSEDAIKAFCKVALASEEEGRLIALGRSPAPEDNNRIVAISYDEKEIAVISRTGMEVR